MSSMIREVISGLECCLNGERYVNGSCRKCPYEWLKIHCREILYQDAIKLLREKEFEESKTTPCPTGTTRWNPVNPDRCMSSDKFECDECKGIVRFAICQDECDYDFCPWCGRRTE